MSDFDNPIINCTVKELAWNAWQLAQGHIDENKVRPGGLILAKLDDPPEKARFEDWWRFAQNNKFGNTRTLCLNAWVDSRQNVITEKENPDFDAWWKMIVDTQPVVGR